MIALNASSPVNLRRLIWATVALGLIGIGAVAWQAIEAQVGGERGIAPIAASGDISIGGIEVNVTGDSAEDARYKGWQLAQRMAWEKLGGPALPDSRIDSMVSAVVIEQEQIGPRRYVATLGVIFDKARAGSILGQSGPRTRSAPMLLLPVLIEGGTVTMYERRNPWQRIWAEYQAGTSAIDYVRPSGSGGESLLLNYGQTSRRSRLWWRNIMQQFGAADVIIPIAKLERQWPGGPVEGHFVARYGPENRFLEEFRLTAASENGVPKMLDQAMNRFDTIFTSALRSGKLKPDPTLGRTHLSIDPAIQRLIDAGRRAQEQDRQTERQQRDQTQRQDNGSPVPATEPTAVPTAEPTEAAEPAAPTINSFVIQFATPDPAALDAGMSAVRNVAGVQRMAIRSTALGGTSVMSVTYAGELSALAAALRARGWNVSQGAGALSISR